MLIDERLQAIEGLEIACDQDITKMTTFRLESRADIIIVKNKNALIELMKYLSEKKREYLVIGLGANQILPQKLDTLVIHLKFDFDGDSLSSFKDFYVIPASVNINHLTAAAVKHGLKGWEVFTGIPATLGGALYMNAGTSLGEIGSIVDEVYLVDREGNEKTHKVGEGSFSYRSNHFVNKGDIIIGAKLIHRGKDEEIPAKIKAYLEFRKKSQPLATKNCGCVFKNPSPLYQAGRLIDQLGLKGLRRGGLQVSLKHANFIENQSTSNWDDFRELTEMIKWQMNMFYGIEFELEVKIPYH